MTQTEATRDPLDGPIDVDKVSLAFPANVSHLMPDHEDIPEQYLRGRSWANRLFTDWFFFGLESVELPWREGIDPEMAGRHLHAVMRSFEPKHEHKEAAWAYLVDAWTDGEATWTKKSRTGHPTEGDE